MCLLYITTPLWCIGRGLWWGVNLWKCGESCLSWTPANEMLICLFSSDLSIISDKNNLNLRECTKSTVWVMIFSGQMKCNLNESDEMHVLHWSMAITFFVLTKVWARFWRAVTTLHHIARAPLGGGISTPALTRSANRLNMSRFHKFTEASEVWQIWELRNFSLFCFPS